ncbi:PstC family ABC transporter permease [Desulfosarcina ovata]|uniref:Phosphate ABC transporter permease n=1 Tax=Desulfosarcina ovata subsp. ovata TaxID=2752305 RepID=A0A5K8ADK7_9BACT|nr:ABC transporter permease subunit [Desulfosarcina ovata]BBO90657.1 phosphate ABC transporter permease [Desulfosarcina ovata subsp. ovata]
MSKIAEPWVRRLLGLMAAFSVAVTVLMFGFMVTLGLPLITEGTFFNMFTGPWQPGQGAYGIAPMIVGTAVIAGLGMAVSFPVSLGCAALISVLGRGWLPILLHRLVRFMTGIPTVVYGFAGIFLLVPLVREWAGRGSGLCILSAGLLLAVLIAPTMILFFTDSFATVPRSYLQAADALGASPVQKLIHVFIPCAWPGLVNGVVLAMGRAVGDTLIALMIAGNATAMPGALTEPARTLTAHIALVVAADFDSLEFRTLFACGIILYLCTTLMVVLTRGIGALRERRP